MCPQSDPGCDPTLPAESGRTDESLPLEAQQRIDQVCVAFESVWKSGGTPQIQHYLGDTTGAERSALLGELLRLELDYLQHRGVTPTPEPYRAQFPEHQSQVAAAFQDHVARIAEARPPGTKVRYFGDYEILEELARGGMGIVYKARQVSLNRVVALKMIRSGQLATPAEVERFHREAEAAANLQHPQIVAIHEVGQHDGQYYFSMDYVEGQSLKDLIAGDPQPSHQAAEYVQQIAQAIDYAHERGILHRDLKPANILIDASRQPRITDFGLAKRMETDSGLTHTREILGTPSYMPPEQAEGRWAEVGRVSDVYSLGAILYELLTGRPPFRGETPTDTLSQVLHHDPLAPRLLNPKAPRDLETICLKCLEKDRARRYPTARELAEELGRFLEGKSIHARPVTQPVRVWRWCRRNRAVAVLSTAAAILLLVLAIGGPLVAVRQAEKAETIRGLLTENEGLLNRAQDGEERATREAADARAQRDEARRAQQEAERATAAVRRAKYVADMKRVESFWGLDDLGAMRNIVRGHLPTSGAEDLRGFEWYYWWRRCHQDGTVWRHAGSVQRVAASPDGRHLASAEAGGTITLWDAASGKSKRTFRLKNADCVALAFSANGDILAAAGGQGRVTMWDLASGGVAHDGGFPRQNLARGCAAFDAACGSYAWSFGEKIGVRDRLAGQHSGVIEGGFGGIQIFDDGKHITTMPALSVLSKGPAEVLRMAPAGFQQWFSADEQAPPPRARGGPVFCLAFSPDRTLLAAGGYGGTVKLWTLGGGHEKHTLKGHAGIVWSVAFSPVGSAFASGGADGKVVIWDLETGSKRSEFVAHAGDVYDVVFLRDGQLLATAGRDSTLKLWNARTGELRAILKGHEAAVNALAVCGRGQQLASASEDGTVRVWAVPQGDEQILCAIPSATMRGASFSPDKRCLAWVVQNDPRDRLVPLPNITGQSVERLELWDWNRGEKLANRLLEMSPDAPVLAHFSRDGRHLAVRALVHELLVKGSESCLEQRSWGQILGPGTFFPDSKALAVADYRQGKVHLRGMDPRSDLATLDTQAAFCLFVSVAPDGRLLAVAADQDVQLWDVQNRALQATLEGHSDFVRCLAFTSDGQTLASASSDGTVILWDVGARTAQATLRGHQGGVSWLAISPDDKTLATAGWDGLIKLWNLSSGEEKTTLKGHAGPVTSVAFSPDGRNLVSTSADGTVRMWRGASDEEVQARVSSDAALGAVRLTPSTRAAGALAGRATRPETAGAGTTPATIATPETVAPGPAAMAFPMAKTWNELETARWILQNGGQVTVAVEGKAPFDVAQVKDLPQQFRVTRVLLKNSPSFTDDEMSRLAVLRDVEWLDLTDQPISDAGLRHLTKLGKLRTLLVQGTGVTPAGLAQLKPYCPLLNVPPSPSPALRPAGRSAARQAGDLLTIIDPKRDAQAGSWESQGDGLVGSVAPDGQEAILQLPIKASDQYDFVVTVQRTAGTEGIMVGIVVGGRQCLAVFEGWPSDGYRTGLHVLDGVGLEQQNEHVLRGRVLPEGKPVTIGCRVRRVGKLFRVVLICDGRELLQWEGDAKRLSLQPGHRPRRPDALFLNLGGDTVAHFSSVQYVDIAARERSSGTSPSGDAQHRAAKIAERIAAAAEKPIPRPWRNAAGERLCEAQIVEVKDDKVRLETQDGRTVDTLVADLLEADRAYAQSWQQRQVQARALAMVTRLKGHWAVDEDRGDTPLVFIDINPYHSSYGPDPGPPYPGSYTHSYARRPPLKPGETLLIAPGIERATNSDLAELRGLATLEMVDLSHNDITDAGLEHLQGLANLANLDLSFTGVTDAGLVHLKGLTKLETLRLNWTGVTTEGVVHRSIFPESRGMLKRGISDAGLMHLEGLKNLEFLDLGLNAVSKEGVKRLQPALPKCKIATDTWDGQ